MVCRSRYVDDPSLSVAERDARRQVGMLRGFYSHLMVFVAVNTGLLAINLIGEGLNDAMNPQLRKRAE